MENLPIYVYLVFGLTVSAALFLFYKATNHSTLFLVIVVSWMIAQTVISFSGFYKITNTLPPRVGLLLMPPLVMTIILFSTNKGKIFVDNLNAKSLTLFHIIRLPVELTLFWLFMHKLVPELMTFEGRNFDIISGISAPVIFYFGFVKRKLSRKIILLWNFACLGLLVNIAINAILSVPGAFQHFAFDQPNIGILMFPFVFLPSVLVPMVLFSHLAMIRRISLGKKI
ncbi:hypothetical protein [Dyadobacter sp. CY356]|uniref:hypothetical protein n=1 Tax=Dyadobacter sp. CY356 TaxID=2906442 RepID=UPI001F163397|nr:hypothetical protein [Dyadobacter sp. CY356]MCF0056840.1 hypothetical protein [Dyadobacter sp. CY356]